MSTHGSDICNAACVIIPICSRSRSVPRNVMSIPTITASTSMLIKGADALYIMERYLRQAAILDQERLSRSRVLVAGTGGLGNFVATELVLAGVGNVDIVDPDVIESHNLNRQFLFREEDLGAPKAAVIADRLKMVNPYVSVRGIVGSWRDVDVNDYDLVFDCMDAWTEKAGLMQERKGPIVFGSVGSSVGMVSVLRAKRLNVSRISSASNVAAAHVGVVASIMALEGLRELSGVPSVLRDKLLHIDLSRLVFTVLEV